ncbi:MAG: hypothetical protein ACFCUQ_08240 [Kiloniellales bacterium]
MFQAIKKLLGADEETKAARQKAAEEERREREARVQQRKDELEKTAEASRDQA